MKEAEINIIDRFLYKLIITTILLLAVVTLDRMEIVEMETVRNEMSQNINILKIVQFINGEKNFFIPIDISEDVTVSTNAYKNFAKLNDGFKVSLTSLQGVENYMAGVVMEIYHNSDGTYRLKIKGIDGYEYIYDKLENYDVNLYKVVNSGEIIGQPHSVGNETYFEFYVYDKGNVIELLK